MFYTIKLLPQLKIGRSESEIREATSLKSRHSLVQDDRFQDTCIYSKTCVKRPLKNRQNKDFNDKW